LPPIERYAAAAQAGFAGVEVAFPYAHPAAEVATRLRDNGLTLVQMIAPALEPGATTSQACWPDGQARFRAGFEKALDYAAQVGALMIHVVAGTPQPGVSHERSRGVFLENLAFAADAAAAREIGLILEPVCRARLPGFLYARIEEAAEIVRAVGRSNVKLCFDTYHVQEEEGALEAVLDQAFPLIGHIQVGDAPERHEPGTGVIDFPRFWTTLAEREWQGWIGCEYVPSAATERSFGWIDEASRRLR
jgi:hydroxypyruvate isomerase